jgi:hypothetical protein
LFAGWRSLQGSKIEINVGSSIKKIISQSDGFFENKPVELSLANIFREC